MCDADSPQSQEGGAAKRQRGPEPENTRRTSDLAALIDCQAELSTELHKVYSTCVVCDEEAADEQVDETCVKCKDPVCPSCIKKYRECGSCKGKICAKPRKAQSVRKVRTTPLLPSLDDDPMLRR
ncbi:hypothetical protein B484DRAFT_407891 [Ochromonadaceae sp. CCMP2298]|nr:hypothetical protein B484DRAFT_407891 [Ochromonadaceae sp. CCMP2298]